MASDPPSEAAEPASTAAGDGAARSGRLLSLVGQSAIYGLGGILARVVGIFLVPVYLAAAGTEAFGTAELVTSAVIVASIVLRLGIVSAMARFTLAESPTGDWSPVIHTIHTFVLSVSTTAAVAGFLLRGQIADLLNVSEGAAAAGVLGVWALMNYDVLARLYRVERRPGMFVAFQLANVAVTVALTLVLVVVYDQGAVGLLVGNFAATAAIYLAMAFARRRSIGVSRASRSVAGELLRYSIPLMPTSVAIWFINFADRIQVQRLAGPEELGQYAAAAKVAAGMTLFLAAFQAAWTPFAHALRGEEGDEVAKRTYADVFTFWALTMGWGVVTLTLASAPYIALTFPADAQAAIEVVPLLAAGIVLYGLYLIVSIGVTIAKRTRGTPVIAAIAAALTIGLNFWFIPAFGIVGAGITTVIGFAVLAVLQWLNARRMYPISYDWPRVARVAAWTAALMALSVWAVPASGAVGIALRLALVAVYPLGLLAIRAVTVADVRRLVAAWRTRRRTRRPTVEEPGEPGGTV